MLPLPHAHPISHADFDTSFKYRMLHGERIISLPDLKMRQLLYCIFRDMTDI